MTRLPQLLILAAFAAMAALAPAGPPTTGPAASRPAAHAVIITGLGNDKAYSRNLLDWAGRCRAVLTAKCGLAPANVAILTETADPKADPPRARATVENVRAAFAKAKARVGPRDQFILFLAGHGQINEELGKLCLPGRDLRADQLEEMLADLPTNHIVIINAASGGAEFLKNTLKAGRVILTGCGYETEGNQSYFAEFVLRAFETGEADRLKGYGNRDGAVDLFEAYCYAARWTANWYHRQYRADSYRPGGRPQQPDDPHLYWVVRGRETRKIWDRLYAGTRHRSVRPAFRPVRDKATGKLVTTDPLPPDLDAEADFEPKWGRFDKHWHFRRMLAETARLDDTDAARDGLFLWQPYKFKPCPPDPAPGEPTWLARRTVLGRPERPAKIKPHGK